MTSLAYIDVRPFLFIGGLPLFIGLCLLVCGLANARFKKGHIALFSALFFSSFFTVFLTGIGPFIDQKTTREYMMTWEIMSNPSNGMKESEVVLTFVEFPGHYIGEYSDELASHLIEHGEQPVKVVIEITSDYGKIRGFHETSIAGLREWKSEWGYAGSSGSAGESPWN